MPNDKHTRRKEIGERRLRGGPRCENCDIFIKEGLIEEELYEVKGKKVCWDCKERYESTE